MKRLLPFLLLFALPAFAQPTRHDFDKQTSSGTTSLTGTIGGTGAAFTTNDLCMAFISIDANATITSTNGWTILNTLTNGSSLKTQYEYKYNCGPATYTWNFGSSVGAALVLMTFTGTDPTTPVNASNGQTTPGGSTNHAAPAVTTTAANTLLLGLWSVDSPNGITPPGDMTAWWNHASTSPSSTSATRVQTSAGSSGTETATTVDFPIGTAELIALQPPIPTATPTAASTGTNTRTPTITNTPTRTNTQTQTQTRTNTITPGGPTFTVTQTPTITNTGVNTNTPTVTPTAPACSGVVTQEADLGTYVPSTFTVTTIIPRGHVLILLPDPQDPDPNNMQCAFPGCVFLDSQNNQYFCTSFGQCWAAVKNALNPGATIPYPYQPTSTAVHVYEYSGLATNCSIVQDCSGASGGGLVGSCNPPGDPPCDDDSFTMGCSPGGAGLLACSSNECGTVNRFTLLSDISAPNVTPGWNACVGGEVDCLVYRAGCFSCPNFPPTPTVTVSGTPTRTPSVSPTPPSGSTATHTPASTATRTIIPTQTPTRTRTVTPAPTGPGVCMAFTPTPTICPQMEPVKIFAVPRHGEIDLAENRFAKESGEQFAIACMYSREMRHDERIVTEGVVTIPIFNASGGALTDCALPVVMCEYIDEQRVIWTVFDGTDQCSYQMRVTAVADSGRRLTCNIRMDVQTVTLQP